MARGDIPGDQVFSPLLRQLIRSRRSVRGGMGHLVCRIRQPILINVRIPRSADAVVKLPGNISA